MVRVISGKTKTWGKHGCEFPKVQFPKVSNQRVAFLAPDQAKALLDAIKTQPITDMFNDCWTVADKKPGLVFPARGEGHQKRVSPVFARTVGELGLNDGVTDSKQRLVYHSLRHSFASWLVMGGESLQTVKELMGHKGYIQTTMRYSHLAPDIKWNAGDNLVSTLNPGVHGKRKVNGLNNTE